MADCQNQLISAANLKKKKFKFCQIYFCFHVNNIYCELYIGSITVIIKQIFIVSCILGVLL